SIGQTYITRFQNRFYQLPVSYFTPAKKWANSPQYPAHQAVFNRPITSRCFECHTTFAQKISALNREPEEFDPTKFIYGVDCEKCHGPGAKHVDFQTQNPGVKTAKYIINPSAFTRQQSLDLCILCHGGRLRKTAPSFSYVPGGKLEDYFAIDITPPAPGSIDVHGNQYGMLSESKCFQQSQTMTCLTCHNTHVNERKNITVFSQRCMTCHSNGHGNECPQIKKIGPSIKNNCIDCHMPRQESQAITELLPGQTNPTAALIRSHLIKIYPQNKPQ
ncbi:MAG: hypothetical protein JST68_16440, partial [Bacteroidetes bacterium]|nr:hypothetical protein [Bacteroidota bacterium]